MDWVTRGQIPTTKWMGDVGKRRSASNLTELRPVPRRLVGRGAKSRRERKAGAQGRRGRRTGWVKPGRYLPREPAGATNGVLKREPKRTDNTTRHPNSGSLDENFGDKRAEEKSNKRWEEFKSYSP
jgi:hypothetical protein